MYDDVVEAALEAETFDWPVKPYLDRDDDNQSLFILVGTILITFAICCTCLVVGDRFIDERELYAEHDIAEKSTLVFTGKEDDENRFHFDKLYKIDNLLRKRGLEQDKSFADVLNIIHAKDGKELKEAENLAESLELDLVLHKNQDESLKGDHSVEQLIEKMND